MFGRKNRREKADFIFDDSDIRFRFWAGCGKWRGFFSNEEIDRLWSIWESDKEDSYKFIIEIFKTVSPEEDIADELMEILTDDAGYFSECIKKRCCIKYKLCIAAWIVSCNVF